MTFSLSRPTDAVDEMLKGLMLLLVELGDEKLLVLAEGELLVSSDCRLLLPRGPAECGTALVGEVTLPAFAAGAVECSGDRLKLLKPDNRRPDFEAGSMMEEVLDNDKARGAVL